MEKSNFQLTSKAQYLGILIDHPKEDLPDGLLECQILRDGGEVPSSLVTVCEDVAAVGHIAFQELFVPRG